MSTRINVSCSHKGVVNSVFICTECNKVHKISTGVFIALLVTTFVLVRAFTSLDIQQTTVLLLNISLFYYLVGVFWQHDSHILLFLTSMILVFHLIINYSHDLMSLGGEIPKKLLNPLILYYALNDRATATLLELTSYAVIFLVVGYFVFGLRQSHVKYKYGVWSLVISATTFFLFSSYSIFQFFDILKIRYEFISDNWILISEVIAKMKRIVVWTFILVLVLIYGWKVINERYEIPKLKFNISVVTHALEFGIRLSVYMWNGIKKFASDLKHFLILLVNSIRRLAMGLMYVIVFVFCSLFFLCIQVALCSMVRYTSKFWYEPGIFSNLNWTEWKIYICSILVLLILIYVLMRFLFGRIIYRAGDVKTTNEWNDFVGYFKSFNSSTIADRRQYSHDFLAMTTWTLISIFIVYFSSHAFNESLSWATFGMNILVVTVLVAILSIVGGLFYKKATRME